VIVVSNTSPIINLASIEQLDLLRELYDRITIPDAVYHEIAVVGAGLPGATEVQTLDWIETRKVTNTALATALQVELDVGEAEAIALAVELQADLLLLDERRARAVASRLGVAFVGLLGVLVDAKHEGLISNVRPLLDSLTTRAGFWITRELYTDVLKAVGEG
jgi:predicted nucleic acid-binding protein